jgi:hypothetical protein
MGAEIQKVMKETDTHCVFLNLCDEIVQTNEKLCELRPVPEENDENEAERLKKNCRPFVKNESNGRKGKSEDGKAKTREPKFGWVFTQTSVDEDGYPIRDEASTSCVGSIETADPQIREYHSLSRK